MPLVEEIVLPGPAGQLRNTTIQVKFLRTIRVSTITNSHFLLFKEGDPLVPVLDPFDGIDISADYNATSRTLILYFSDTLETETEYRFTISGLHDASGAAIPAESYTFTTGTESTPVSPVDPLPDSPDFEDHSVRDDDVGSSSDLLVTANPDFYITATDPSREEPLVSTGYADGRVTVKFSTRPAATFLNAGYFRAQKKPFQRQFTRWEDVSTLVTMDPVKPWVFVDFPSMDATPVYRTAGKEYFPEDYKFRLRVSRDVDTGGTTPSAAGSQLDILIEQGATFRRTLTLLHADGTPRDLSGYTGRMQIRASYSSSVVLELTSANGGITIDALAGKVSLEISAAQTSALTIKTGVYDVEIVSGDATPVVTRLLAGKVTVSPEVTHD